MDVESLKAWHNRERVAWLTTRSSNDPEHCETMAEFHASAIALLSAARDEGRAEGLGGEWVMVPVEPTEAMLAKGHHMIDWSRTDQPTNTNDNPLQKPGGVGTNCKEDLRDAWRAMIDARPLPTEGDAGRAALEAEKTTHQEPKHER